MPHFQSFERVGEGRRVPGYLTFVAFSQIPSRTSLAYRACRMHDPIEPGCHGRAFHQVGAKAEKALPLVEDSQMSLRLGISSKFLLSELRGLLGTCHKRWSHRYEEL